MTELLQKAFAEAARLPEEDQDMLAKALLQDFAAEERLGHNPCEFARQTCRTRRRSSHRV